MTTEERLKKLEHELFKAKRSNRRLILGGGGLLLGLFVLLVIGRSMTSVVYGQEKAGGKTVIRANEFVLLDEQGRERGKMHMLTNSPTLALCDEKGNAKAMLKTTGIGPALVMLDDQGKDRVILTVNKNRPGLHLYDENDEVRALLSGGPEAMLSLADKKGTPLAVLRETENGVELGMFDHENNTGVRLATSKEQATLSLYDKKCEKQRVMLFTDDEAGPGLSLGDEKGNMRASLIVHPIFGPVMTLFDEKGQSRAQFGVGQIQTVDGKVTSYPESSMRLIGPDGKGIWQAP